MILKKYFLKFKQRKKIKELIKQYTIQKEKSEYWSLKGGEILLRILTSDEIQTIQNILIQRQHGFHFDSEDLYDCWFYFNKEDGLVQKLWKQIEELENE